MRSRLLNFAVGYNNFPLLLSMTKYYLYLYKAETLLK
jgi:hypothetical protein